MCCLPMKSHGCNGGPGGEPQPAIDHWRGDISASWTALSALLLAVYLALNIFTPSDGHLATDTGGKAASLEAMEQRGDWNPDIGYWFAEQDPDGRFFPLEKTTKTDAGTWVNSTSLTMIYLAKPLYDIGGLGLVALLPIIGALLSAASAGALERRVDPLSDGKLSFLIVGLSSSVLVYSTDLWEHTLALAALGFATVLSLDAIRSKHVVRSAFLAGLLLVSLPPCARKPSCTVLPPGQSSCCSHLGDRRFAMLPPVQQRWCSASWLPSRHTRP